MNAPINFLYGKKNKCHPKWLFDSKKSCIFTCILYLELQHPGAFIRINTVFLRVR